MVIFNVLACNTDAHAKNFAILIRSTGAALAPLYDVMCAQAWDTVTRNFAQKIGGQARGDDLTGGDWQRFARDCGLKSPAGARPRGGAR